MVHLITQTLTGFGENHIMMDEQGNTSSKYFSNI